MKTRGNSWLYFIFGIICTTLIDCTNNHKQDLTVAYKWSQLEFNYASPNDRQADIDNGIFIPGKPLPMDVDVEVSADKNRIFITIPIVQNGTPATLGVISDKDLNGNPLITPYPSWEWHRNPTECREDRIVSVYRIKIDECQRLWVIDNGRVLEEQTCPPQLLAFDLKTNELLHRYEIPSEQLEDRSILVTPIVDVRKGKCAEAFVYIADVQTYSIIVHDVRRNTSWRATDKTMYPYPNYGTFNILGDSFDLMDGILGMDLSPESSEDRILFYHAMASPTENWVYTSELRNQTRFLQDPNSSPEIFQTYRGQRYTQSAAEASDKNGVMYFGLLEEVTINCWNTRTEYGPYTRELISNNREILQFPSGIKVITGTDGEQHLWILTNRYQKLAAQTMSSSEINYRVLTGKIRDLIAGTKCERGDGKWSWPLNILEY